MSKRSRSDEENVPEVDQLNAMVESMPSKMQGMMAGMLAEVRDQFNTCVAATKKSVAEMAEWEEEKKRIAGTHNFEPTVTLNVGGNLFTTTTSTLTRFPDTMLGAMFSGRHALIQDKNGAYFIDRDGTHFREILNFLRGSTASTEEQIEQRLSPATMEELKFEADFYGMKDLMFPSFKPPLPGVIKSKNGTDSIVTQGEDQLWYIKHPSNEAPICVNVCNHCCLGLIDHIYYPNFTRGRFIDDEQPRIPGTCPDCKQRQNRILID